MKKHLTSIKYNFQFLVTVIIISIASIFFVNSHVKEDLEEFKTNKFNSIVLKVEKQIEVLIQEKSNSTTAIGLALSHHKDLIKLFEGADVNSLSLQNITNQFRQNNDFQNVWFQVISSEGISLYRNWSNKKGDNVTKARIDVAKMLEEPKVMSTISVGKFDLTFKAMVPIYNDSNKFMGIFEVITHFNSITKKLQKEGLETVLLADKKYIKQLKYPFTKIFLNDYYIANLDAKQKYIDFIKNKMTEHFINSDQKYHYDKENNNLIIFHKLNDINNQPMSYFIVFNPIESIDMSAFESRKNSFIFQVIIFVFILVGLLHYINTKKFVDNLHEQNEIQLKLNQELSKSLEKQKKLQEEKDKEHALLIKSSKDAAMGEMIDAIAHQWKNPLGVIKLLEEEIKLNFEVYDKPDIKQVLENSNTVIVQVNHLLNTLEEFRSFFRPEAVYQDIKIKNLIQSVQVLMKDDLIKNTISIETYGDLDAVVHIIPNEFKHVFINLLTNSRDAFNEKEIKENRLITYDVEDHEIKTVIKVIDNAGGIPQDIIYKIFEANFTTKEKGQGTGIGLYMTKQILDKIDADVKVYNLNDGVCFEISVLKNKNR